MPLRHCKHTGHLIVTSLFVRQSITQLLLKLKPKSNMSSKTLHSKISSMGSERLLHFSSQLILHLKLLFQTFSILFQLTKYHPLPSQRVISFPGFQERKGYHMPIPCIPSIKYTTPPQCISCHLSELNVLLCFVSYLSPFHGNLIPSTTPFYFIHLTLSFQLNPS